MADLPAGAASAMDAPSERGQTDERSTHLVRLTRIEGHVRGIVRMVERDAEATEVLDQIVAVTRALKSLAADVADGQIRQYLPTAAQLPDATEMDRVLRQVRSMVERVSKV